ncbi:MAG: hypothetical protein LBO66_11015 [Deltaproteobacteria bacterium]|nr:hypothetical protein [Deltaproteobacteria bacterium]
MRIKWDATVTETGPALWTEAGEDLSHHAASARLEALTDKEASKKMAL